MDKIYLVSLGCAKNLVDSEVIQGTLVTSGYTLTRDKEAAEIIIVNTCAFIEEATREAISTILELSEQKRVGACRYLVVCGCLPQRYKEALLQELPEVDLFLGTGEFQHIAQHLKTLKQGHYKSKVFTARPTYLLNPGTPRILATPGYTAYVKIAEGCSHHCTYCIIPEIRGPYKSRSPQSIAAEVKNLAARGVREINLIAQDTTYYGLDSSCGSGLAGLLKKLVKIPDIRWIRLLYCHPHNLTEELISILAGKQTVCNYLDLPLQHISDPVLKRMGRRTTTTQIQELLQMIRSRVPAIALRTTLMVGFPGETEKDFAQLRSFVQTFAFEHLGIFRYRDEEGTAACKLTPKVPEGVKEERYHDIMTLQSGISRKKNRRRAGQRIEVLVEGASSSPKYALQGRAAFQAPEVDGVIFIEKGKASAGSFVKVRITKGLTYDLVGEIV